MNSNKKELSFESRDFQPDSRITFRPSFTEEYNPLEDSNLSKLNKPAEIHKPVERYEYKSDFAKKFMDQTTSNNSTGFIQ